MLLLLLLRVRLTLNPVIIDYDAECFNSVGGAGRGQAGSGRRQQGVAAAASAVLSAASSVLARQSAERRPLVRSWTRCPSVACAARQTVCRSSSIVPRRCQWLTRRKLEIT